MEEPAVVPNKNAHVIALGNDLINFRTINPAMALMAGHPNRPLNFRVTHDIALANEVRLVASDDLRERISQFLHEIVVSAYLGQRCFNDHVVRAAQFKRINYAGHAGERDFESFDL
jgi:hypothetical protein